MKSFKEAKKVLRGDPELLTGFVSVAKRYRSKFAVEKSESLSDFIKENANISLSIFNKLKSKSFYYDKEALSNEFYREFVSSVADEVASIYGSNKVFKKIDNKVGFSNEKFLNIEEVLKECTDDENFKDAFLEVYKSCNNHNKPDISNLNYFLDDKIKADALIIANIVKDVVYYKDKENLTPMFYNEMIEDAKNKAKSILYPEKKVENSMREVKNEFDTEDYDKIRGYKETIKQIKKAFVDANTSRKNGSTLATDYNPISSQSVREQRGLNRSIY